MGVHRACALKQLLERVHAAASATGRPTADQIEDRLPPPRPSRNAAALAAWLEAALGTPRTGRSATSRRSPQTPPAQRALGFRASACSRCGTGSAGAIRSGPPWVCRFALAAGMNAFEELLEAHARMDAHFRNEPLERNMPVVLALLEIWYVNFFGAQTRAVIPYSEDLRDLPAYLQQLEMESNGKRVDRDGNEVDYATAPAVWGASGTPSQHSFHQLLHQGTHLIPVDFIVIGRNGEPSSGQDALVANALAQSAALAFGNPAPGAPHKAPPRQPPFEHPASRAPHAAARSAHSSRCMSTKCSRRRHLEPEQARSMGVEHGKNLAPHSAAETARGRRSSGTRLIDTEPASRGLRKTRLTPAARDLR